MIHSRAQKNILMSPTCDKVTTSMHMQFRGWAEAGAAAGREHAGGRGRAALRHGVSHRPRRREGERPEPSGYKASRCTGLTPQTDMHFSAFVSVISMDPEIVSSKALGHYDALITNSWGCLSGAVSHRAWLPAPAA